MELSYFAIIIGAIFVNNVVLAQFLGICPFLGVSSKVDTSLGMSAAVTFVMALASIVAWCIQTYILVPLEIEYMQTIVFILVIAALVQMVEIILAIADGIMESDSILFEEIEDFKDEFTDHLEECVETGNYAEALNY